MTSGFDMLHEHLSAAGYAGVLGVKENGSSAANGNSTGSLHLPMIDQLGPDLNKSFTTLLSPLAQVVSSPKGYSVASLASSRLSVLRPVIEAYNSRHNNGQQFYQPHSFPGLLAEFSARLADELQTHRVETTPGRIANLFAYRYARGLGLTVDRSRAGLPPALYTWIGADINPRITLINFSAYMNPVYSGRTPIPVEDAPALEGMSLQYIRSLFAPHLPQDVDFS